MRKSYKSQPMRSRKETERLLREMTAKVEALVKVTEKYSFEKDIDKLKLTTNELRRRLLEALAKLKRFAEDRKVEKQLLDAVDKLKQDEEEQVSRLLKAINEIKYLSEKTEEDKGFRNKELENIQKEALTIFTNITDRVDSITDDIIRYVIEDEQHIFEEASLEIQQGVEQRGKQFMSMVSDLNLITEAVNAGKQLSNKIDELKGYIEETGRDLLADSIELKLVPGKPGADKEYKLAELSRVWKKENTFYEETTSRADDILVELQPFIKAKKLRQRTLSIASSIFLILLNTGNYILTSNNLDVMPSTTIELLTWIITGLPLIILSIVVNVFFSRLTTKYLFILKRRLLKLTTIILFILFSSIIINLGIYTIAQHYVFIVLFPIVKYISTPNQVVGFLGTTSAIVTILLFLGAFLRKQMPKILIWLP